MNYRDAFIVKPGSRVRLANIDPNYTGAFTGKNAKQEARKRLEANQERLNEQQTRMYAGGEYAALLINQAPDAAGKDGLIKHVYGAMNPQGTRTVSFKAPSPLERSHHFLWRIRQNEPPKGHVSIFNRSHYEDVLIVRVRNLVPEDVWKRSFKTIDEFWEARFREINDYERSLAQNGTQVLKFFLHISPQEQLKRFWDRVNEPQKNWKISDADYTERALWNEYQKAYEAALSATSTKHAPWFIIPANKKWFARLAVSEIVASHFESLGMQYPKPVVDADEIKRKYFGVNSPGDKPRFDLI